VSSSFPKITICNINQFTTKFAYDYLSKTLNESLLKNSEHFSKASQAFLFKYFVQSQIKNESLIIQNSPSTQNFEIEKIKSIIDLSTENRLNDQSQIKILSNDTNIQTKSNS
jgi:hypothetical protein